MNVHDSEFATGLFSSFQDRWFHVDWYPESRDAGNELALTETRRICRSRGHVRNFHVPLPVDRRHLRPNVPTAVVIIISSHL